MIQITTVVKFKTSILKFRGNPNVINRTILNLPCVLESFFLINLGNHYSANFYPMKTMGTGNYGVPCRENPHYLWKRAVRITKKPYICCG